MVDICHSLQALKKNIYLSIKVSSHGAEWERVGGSITRGHTQGKEKES